MALKKPIVLNSGVLSQLDDVMYAPLGILAGVGVEDPSAVANFSSTTKGILVPRLTTAQRDAIATPGSSLFIFNKDSTKFNYYDGAAWQEIGPLGIVDGGTY